MRNKGEGSFYQNNRGQWVGRTPNRVVTVKLMDRAEAFEQWRKSMDRYREGARSKANPTVNDLWDALIDLKLQKGRQPATIAWYEDARTAHLGPIAPITASTLNVDDVEQWLKDCQRKQDKDGRPLGSKYLRGLKGALGQALDIGMRRDILTRNVARLAETPQGSPDGQATILDDAEMRHLLGVTDGDRLAAWLVLMLHTGTRPHEAYELSWFDVDLSASTITLRPRKSKAAKARTIEVPVVVRTALAAHRVTQTEERLMMGPLWPTEHDHLVFRSEAGTPIDGANMRRRLTAWLEAAGIDKHLSPYDLRHTFASHAADRGEPITRLADYMGNDPVTLERYYRQPVTPVMKLGVDLTAQATR